MYPKRISSLIILCLLFVTLVGCSEPSKNNPISSDNPSTTSSTNIPDSFLNISGDANQRRQDALNGLESNAFIGTLEIRRYNGQDNNQSYRQWNWGSTFSHLQRLGPVAYGDGISSLAGQSRKSPREISNLVVAQAAGETTPNTFNTSDFLWQWGQFIDHDIDLTDGTSEPANITVPRGDRHFDPRSEGNKEIRFGRALFDPTTGTSADNPREQENEITSWIDGSMVYGTYLQRIDALRVGRNSPFLKTDSNNLLPKNTLALTNANGPVPNATSLFLAGDFRANEQVGLTVMHTLFVREHNRLAKMLQAEFPNKSADEIFERARRLVIAEIQIITYNEFLPALLGQNAIPAYTGYKPSVNPTIYNEFSVAAYRFGHSAISNQLLRLNASGNTIGDIPLQRAFFTAPSLLQNENDIDPFLRGLASQKHQKIDPKISNDLRNFLFGPPGSGGFDLASLNIQRGRDHGVPSYNDMRQAMGLARKTSFAQITNDVALQNALAQAYTSVNDIDLWVGGLAETPHQNSQLGELFTAIIVKQFTELRDGDRFWYMRDLSSEELRFISSTTLAQIIRNNTAVGVEMQNDVFHVRATGPVICRASFVIDNVDTQGDINKVKACNEITGSLRITNTTLTNVSFMDNLVTVGNLQIDHNVALTNLEGFQNLSFINASMYIHDNAALTSLYGLHNVSYVTHLTIHNNDALTSLHGLQNLRSVETRISRVKMMQNVSIQDNDALTTLKGIEGLSSIRIHLSVINNKSLVSLEGLENISSVGYNINIVDNDALTSLRGLRKLSFIGDRLAIQNNDILTSLDGLQNLSSPINRLVINNNVMLNDLNGIQNVPSITHTLSISRSPALTNLNIFRNISFTNITSIFISHNNALTNLNGLENLTVVKGNLAIFNNNLLTNLDGLQNIASIGTRLYIVNNNALTNITALSNLQRVTGNNIVISYNARFDCSPYNQNVPQYFPLKVSTGNRVNCTTQ